MNQDIKGGSFPIAFFVKVLLFQYIMTGLLLALLAFLLYKMGLGEGIVSIAIIVIYIVATVFGGWMTGRKVENRRFLWGLLVGCVYFLLLTVVSFMAGGDNYQVGNSFWTTFVICAGGGMLGGMLS